MNVGVDNTNKEIERVQIIFFTLSLNQNRRPGGDLLGVQ